VLSLRNGDSSGSSYDNIIVAMYGLNAWAMSSISILCMWCELFRVAYTVLLFVNTPTSAKSKADSKNKNVSTPSVELVEHGTATTAISDLKIRTYSRERGTVDTYTIYS